MRSGDLKKLIDIESISVTSDGMGAYVESWSTYKKNVWAAIWPVSAKERIQSGKVEAEITHRIRIRYMDGVTSAMRIKYGITYFKIVSVINVGMENRMIDILAVEES